MIDVAPLNVLSQFSYSLIGVIVVVVLALFFSAYIKIVTVLSIVKLGFGFKGLPSAFVTGGLAMALTYFVMAPTIFESAHEADSIFKNKQTVTADNRNEAFVKASERWKVFVVKYTDPAQLKVFQEVAKKLDKKELAKNFEENKGELSGKAIEWRHLAAAFVVTQLKEAFIIGLTFFLPFLVIELIVATILSAIGMDNIHSQYVSLPFKLLLFVAMNGWTLITTNLVSSYVK